MDESTALTAGFVALLIGLAIVLAGVFMGEVLVVIVVGGIIGLLGIAGFTAAAFKAERAAESGEAH
ncbi:hypothetical protein [Halopiger goleimassiliensis]|uniref:hypothetical protein n=1 Tax=Halopiger goleimassiliensis TaxID=1293048 RepID=UPI0006775F8F|nr:hypothetical protein [Halopiger goleimassiliensis]